MGLSTKGLLHDLAGHKGPCLVLLLALVFLDAPVGHPAANAQDILKVAGDRRITANVADVSLDEALEVLSQRLPLAISGRVDGDERLTVQFSQLTLEEALREMLRGYNYVLIHEDRGKATLILLGKAEGNRPDDRGSSAAAPGEADSKQPASPIPVLSNNDSSVSPSASRPATASVEGSPPAPLSSPASPDLPSIPLTVPSSQDGGAQAPLPGTPTATPGLTDKSQAVAPVQGNLPLDPNAPATSGVAQDPGSQPSFNPAAWGGRGRRGSSASGLK